MKFLGGWTAVIVIAVVAGLSEAFGGSNPWIKKIGWTVAALVAVHAAWQSWTE